MATMRTKGKSQLSTQLDTELLSQLKEYASSRGETLTMVLERAAQREMENPPPVVKAPPLPPYPPGGETGATVAKKGRKKT